MKNLTEDELTILEVLILNSARMCPDRDYQKLINLYNKIIVREVIK